MISILHFLFIGSEAVTGSSTVIKNVPILGLYQTPSSNGGRIVVYGDSNCLDSAHLQRDCFWLLESLLKYATSSIALPPFTQSEEIRPQPLVLPLRMEGKINQSQTHKIFDYYTQVIEVSNGMLIPHLLLFPGNRLHHYSQVLSVEDSSRFRPLPSCPQLKWTIPRPLNTSGGGNIIWPRHLISGGADETSFAPEVNNNRNLKAHPDFQTDEVIESSTNFLWFGVAGIGVGVLWFLCRRRPRTRRAAIFGRLLV